MRHKHHDKHEFALFWPELSGALDRHAPDCCFTATDQNLYHRIVKVLRLSPPAEFILFDRVFHSKVRLIALHPRYTLELMPLTFERNPRYCPEVAVALPLLRREAFEQAVYALSESGATALLPIITSKSQHSWDEVKDSQRVERIMIAAAEQSKHFAYPRLDALQELNTFADSVKDYQGEKIFFDPEGKPLMTLLERWRHQEPEAVTLMVGPEGDLTPSEKNLIAQNGFVFYALTPTVLRAQQAAALALGIARCILSRRC